MTPEQRYLFDLNGYLHLENALSAEELSAASEAADRYISTPPDQLPPGFVVAGQEYSARYGFAFDKALESLVFHSATWPIIREFTHGKPALGHGSVKEDNYKVPALFLHSGRELYGWETLRYEVRDNRIYCDEFVIFFYLTDVQPGDGGLVVVPSSHKRAFDRPPEMHKDGVVENEADMSTGMINITPKAGDIVILCELVTHGALQWKPVDRTRRFLTLRYMTQNKFTDYNSALPEEIKERLSPETRELILRTNFTHQKTIGEQEVVQLS
nr:TPA_exp: hydroxylase [uncultured bacterium]